MRKFFTAITAILVIVMGVSQGAQAAKRGGTLRIGIEGNPPHLDFIRALGTPAKFYRDVSGAALVKLDKNYNIVGDLAHKWEISNDARTITFHLRPGATFHDGTPLDAAAIKWNMDVINNRIRTSWFKKAKKKNPKARFFSLLNTYMSQVEKVEVVDKHTVKFHQKKIGKGVTMSAMAGYFPRISFVSPKAYDKDNKKFRRSPVGGGPFKIVDYKPKRHVMMERNKDYYIKGRPYLDRIEVYYMPNALQRLNALRSGEIDVILNVPKALVATLKKTKGTRLYSGKAATTFAAPINNKRKPWTDIRIRKALTCYGLDRAKIAKTALRGLTVPWATFSAPGSPDAIDLTAMCPYDPQRAKKLLTEAGHSSSNPVKFVMTINNTDPTFNDVSVLMKEMYARLGVKMDIRVVDRATWVNLVIRKRKTDMTLQDSIPTYGINSNSHMFYTGTPFDYMMTKDSKLDAMVEEWRSEIDPQIQMKISHRMQRYLVEKAYYPALAGSPYFQAAKDHVKGWKFMNKYLFDLTDTWLDK